MAVSDPDMPASAMAGSDPGMSRKGMGFGGPAGPAPDRARVPGLGAGGGRLRVGVTSCVATSEAGVTSRVALWCTRVALQDLTPAGPNGHGPVRPGHACFG